MVSVSASTYNGFKFRVDLIGRLTPTFEFCLLTRGDSCLFTSPPSWFEAAPDASVTFWTSEGEVMSVLSTDGALP